MNNLSEHFLILDPIPNERADVRWEQVIHKLARILLTTSRDQAYETANSLTRSIHHGHPLPAPLGAKFDVSLRRSIPDLKIADTEYISRVGGMIAILAVLNNTRLGEVNAATRDGMAVALWSSLEFQRPLFEPRIEYLRERIITSARHAALKMASRIRARSPSSARYSSETARDTIDALRHNSRLDLEENAILRWILANRSDIFRTPFTDIESSELVAITRCLELGNSLQQFPTYQHYQFITQNISGESSISLQCLVNTMGHDSILLANSYRDSTVLTQCPLIFPFLRALMGKMLPDEAEVERPLIDWCGRALLEVAAVRHAATDRETAL